MSSQKKLNIVEHVTALLENSGIGTIAVIDDAYDSPVRADYTDAALNSFFDMVSRDEHLQKELERLGFTLYDPDDVTDELISALWERRDELALLRAPCEKELFTVPAEKLAGLAPLDALLAGTLKRNLQRLGRTQAADATGRIVFLDYFLGPAQGDGAVQRAKETIQALYERIPQGEPKPLIVLMSSIDITPNAIRAFREESPVFGGMFHFITKTHFHDTTTLLLILAGLVSSLQHGLTVQGYIEALEANIPAVSNQFFRELRKLSLGDFAYLQQLSLLDDGQPLGDYINSLYGTYLAKLMFELPTVREKQRQVDELGFEALPPAQIEPSLHFAEIYKSAVFSTSVEPLRGHPRAKNGDNGAEENYLDFGDVFIKSTEAPVLAVITAACDLAYSPDNKNRTFRRDLTVLFVPGDLRSLSLATPRETPRLRTELFEYEGALYRILWDFKRSISMAYGSVAAWMEKEGYVRRARLRLPYALQIQNAFAAHLTRVGLPVAPPFYQTASLDVFYSGPDFRTVVWRPVTDPSAFIFLARNEEYCILHEVFVSEFLRQVDGLRTSLRQTADTLRGIAQSPAGQDEASEKKRERAQKKLVRCEQWLASLLSFGESYEDLARVRGPFALPEVGEESALEGTPIFISRKKKTVDRYEYEKPIVIHLS
jgi:hypothetical protein